MKSRPMLTLEDCRKISAAAEAEAKKNNWNVCIAILDDGGHLLHLARMDGATPANAEIAIEKGRSATTVNDRVRIYRELDRLWERETLTMPVHSRCAGFEEMTRQGAPAPSSASA